MFPTLWMPGNGKWGIKPNLKLVVLFFMQLKYVVVNDECTVACFGADNTFMILEMLAASFWYYLWDDVSEGLFCVEWVYIEKPVFLSGTTEQLQLRWVVYAPRQ